MVIVENRAGGGGTIGTREVARAAPDGHTLLFAGANHSLGPALTKTLGSTTRQGLRADRDGRIGFLEPCSGTIGTGKVGEGTDRLCESEPREIELGIWPFMPGRPCREMFMAATGIDVARISYKGGPQAINDLLGGHVHMNFNTTAFALPLIEEGSFVPSWSQAKRAVPICPMYPPWRRSGCLIDTRILDSPSWDQQERQLPS